MDLLTNLVLQLIPGVGRNNSNSLLSNIAQTQCLFIPCKSIKVLYDEGHLPVIFNKLKMLILSHCGLIDDFIPSMAMFFQEVLQLGLKRLHIIASSRDEVETNSSSRSTSQYGLKFWESQNILFSDRLKELKIELLGGNNEEGLLEYILNNAKNLKRVIVSCGSPLQAQIVNKLITAALARGSNFRYEIDFVKLKPELEFS